MLSELFVSEAGENFIVVLSSVDLISSSHAFVLFKCFFIPPVLSVFSYFMFIIKVGKGKIKNFPFLSAFS